MRFFLYHSDLERLINSWFPPHELPNLFGEVFEKISIVQRCCNLHFMQGTLKVSAHCKGKLHSNPTAA